MYDLELLPLCAGYGVHPQPSDFLSQHTLEAYYYRASAQHLMATENSGQCDGTAWLPLPPPDLQPIVDKTAEYVARNSEQFERTVLEKHCGDPRFGFLNPWNQFYGYYKSKVQQIRALGGGLAESGVAVPDTAQEPGSRDKHQTPQGKKIQKLSQTGSVSFKLEPKAARVLEKPTVVLSSKEEEEDYEEGEPNGEASFQEQQGQTLAVEYEPVTPPESNHQPTPDHPSSAGQPPSENYMYEHYNIEHPTEDDTTHERYNIEYPTQDDTHEHYNIEQPTEDGTTHEHYSIEHPTEDDTYEHYSIEEPTEDYVHYRAEQMVYSSDSGARGETESGEPPAKRAKVAATGIVMDNKVKVSYTLFTLSWHRALR